MSGKASEQEPLASLGYGIVAYVDILYSMIWAFLLFSVMMVPTMQAFKSGNAYEGNVHAGHATSMISNLGYSNMECRNIPMSLGNIAITCPYGTVGKIFDYGINHEESGSPVDSCVNNNQNRGCKPNNGKID
jgi:hypothetical protein